MRPIPRAYSEFKNAVDIGRNSKLTFRLRLSFAVKLNKIGIQIGRTSKRDPWELGGGLMDGSSELFGRSNIHYIGVHNVHSCYAVSPSFLWLAIRYSTTTIKLDINISHIRSTTNPFDGFLSATLSTFSKTR